MIYKLTLQYSENLCKGHFLQWQDSALNTTARSSEKQLRWVWKNSRSTRRAASCPNKQETKVHITILILELQCLKCHVCASFNSSTAYYITLKQMMSDTTPRCLTYPSHCNAIDKCHIRLLASACKKCKETKKLFIFFKTIVLWHQLNWWIWLNF